MTASKPAIKGHKAAFSSLGDGRPFPRHRPLFAPYCLPSAVYHPALVIVLLAVSVWAWSGGCCVAAATEPDAVGVLALVEEDSVAKDLGLSEQQRTKLRDLIDRRETEAIELTDLPRDERAQKLAAFQRESETKGLALLSPQQRARLEQIRIRRLGLGSLAEPAIAQKLGLDKQQQDQVAQILNQRDEGLSRADEKTRQVVHDESERKLALLLSDRQRSDWEALSGGATSEQPAASPATVRPVKPPEADASAAPAATRVGSHSPEAEVAPGRAEPDKADTTAAQAAQPTEPPKTAHIATEQPVEPAAVADDQPPAKPGKIRFNFRYQPWKDVLEWFADKADLSYVADFAPEGTFNYTDTREYTPAEAIDLLNSVLLTKGYTLIRHDRMLMLINLEDEIPPNLISTIPVEELDKRGEYELVSVLFKLDKASPEDVEAEISRLVRKQGSVVTLSKSRQILVTETAGRLRAIRDVIKRMEDPTGLESNEMQALDLQYAFPEEAMTVIRQMLAIPEGQNATPDGSLRFSPDPTGNRLLVTGKPEMLARVQEILKLVDVPGPGQLDSAHYQEQPQLEVYSVNSADPEAVLAVMQTLMAGLPDVRLTIDSKTGNLVALARPSQHKTIKATLEQLERDARTVDVIYLQRVDPQLAVLSINKLFGGGKEGSKGNAPQVDADPTSRQLLVRGTSAQIQEIRDLLVKMGESPTGGTGSGRGNVRVLPLTGEAAEAALEQIQEFWPAMRKNTIRVVTPSALSPTMHSDGSNESALQQLRIPVPRTLMSRAPAVQTPAQQPGAAGTENQPWGDRGRRGPWMRGPRRWGPEMSGPEDRGPGGPATGTSLPQNSPPGAGPLLTQPQQDKSTRHVVEIPIFLVSQTVESDPEPATTQPAEPQPAESQPVEPQPGAQPQPAEPQPAEPQPDVRQPAESQPVEPQPAAEPPPAEPQPAEPQPDVRQPDVTQPAEVQPVEPEPAAQAQPAEPQPVKASPAEAPAAEARPAEAPAKVPTESAVEALPGKSESTAPAKEAEPLHKPVGPSAPIVVTRVPGGLMIACEDTEALDDFERLLTSLAGNMTVGGPQLTIFYLKHAKADVISRTLDEILGGGTIAKEGSSGGGLIGDMASAALGNAGGGILGSLLGLGGGGGSVAPSGPIRITPDSRLNALIVQASPADLNMIEELLKVLDQKGSPEDILVVPKAKIIPVFNTKAEDVAAILKQVYQDRMVASSQPGQPPRPEEVLMALRGGRGQGRSQRGTENEVQKMSIGIDTRTNSLIVAAAEPLLTEVERLIEQLDNAATQSDQSTRIVTLQRTSGEAVQRALSALVGDSVQFGSTGGAGRRSETTGGRGSSTSDSDRRDFFREMMRRRFQMFGPPPGMTPGGGGPGGQQPQGFQRGGSGRGR